MREVFLEGMLIQAGLIFALGPQNLYVLESGLKRRHHLAVSFACFFCDLLLIMAGVIGAATIFNEFPQIKIVVGVIGVGFLILYGIGKLTHENSEIIFNEDKNSGLRIAILNAVTFSIVNPHAYLDGLVLIGGYSSKYSDLDLRLALGLGAATFSLIWFLVLSTGAAIMMPFFQNPKRMRLIMSSAGLVLLFLSAKLSIDVYGWIEDMYPETVASLALWE